jgi:hypothetical protein
MIDGVEGHGNRKHFNFVKRLCRVEFTGFFDDLFQGSSAGDNTAIHDGNLLSTILFDVDNRYVLHIGILLASGVLSINTTTCIPQYIPDYIPRILRFSGIWVHPLGLKNEGLSTCLFPGGNSPAVLAIPAVSVIPRQLLRNGGGSCYAATDVINS